MSRNFLIVDPEEGQEVLRAFASPARARILRLLRRQGPLNVNDIAAGLGLPQSSVSANVQVLEAAGLIRTETLRARKGHQKVCHTLFDEVLVMFRDEPPAQGEEAIEVAMPLGLYTSFEVSAPCGLCTPQGIVGLLDVPDTFLDPGRMGAGLIWFTRGFVEWQFPNNVRLLGGEVAALEVVAELSSEVPGTAADWPSDITVSVNRVPVATWTSPGDWGDRRGLHTPGWWKLKGSQYGHLKAFRVTREGTFVDGARVSDVSIAALDLAAHRSIRVSVGVREDARHPGGVNIFGRGFGNHGQDVALRLMRGRAAEPA